MSQRPSLEQRHVLECGEELGMQSEDALDDKYCALRQLQDVAGLFLAVTISGRIRAD